MERKNKMDEVTLGSKESSRNQRNDCVVEWWMRVGSEGEERGEEAERYSCVRGQRRDLSERPPSESHTSTGWR